MKTNNRKMVLEDEGTVLDKGRERMDTVWEDYTSCWISFSGGKDSGSVLSLAMDAWERNGPFLGPDGERQKINVVHFDDEFHYPETLDYIERVLDKYGDRLNFYWFTLPIKYGFATSGVEEYDSKYWKPWNPKDEENWFREHPKNEAVTDLDCVEVIDLDHEWIDVMDDDMKHKHYATRVISQNGTEDTVQLVGVRTAESLNRHTALLSHGDWRHSTTDRWKDTTFSFIVEDGVEFDTAYPIYDWKDRDLWKIHADEGWDYNKAYDKLHRLGFAPRDMRTGQPWGYMTIRGEGPQREKHHWADQYDEWASRHQGMDAAFSYGIDFCGPMKPESKTWEEYSAMLLNNVENEERRNELSQTIQNRLEKHFDTSRSALPQKGICDMCSQSWRQIADDIYEEVFGVRTGQA